MKPTSIHPEEVYLDLIDEIMHFGTVKGDRTGTGTRSVFGAQMRFPLFQHGFPLFTTKRTWFKGVVAELLWFLKGDTNTHYLQERGVHIWNEWATKEGNLGPIYGKQWTDWNGKNQIVEMVDLLRRNPDSRRMIVSAWNVDDLPDETLSPQENVKQGKMALSPCHALFQFYSAPLNDVEKAVRYRQYVADTQYIYGNAQRGKVQVRDAVRWDVEGFPQRKLSIQLYQRSADIFLGVPFNVASYALLLLMMSQVTNHVPGEMIWSGGDVHLYNNHQEQARILLKRNPMSFPRVTLSELRDVKDIFLFNERDITLSHYEHHPAIPAPIAI